MILLVLNDKATFMLMQDWHDIATRQLTFDEAIEVVRWCEESNGRIGLNHLMEEIYLYKCRPHKIKINYSVKIEDTDDAIVFKMKWN